MDPTQLRWIRTIACLAATLGLVGCGTTRSSDTLRTATEQLLVSDAVDRAIQSVNLTPLAGQTVYLDDSRMADVVDKNYIVSTLRQHMLASGCILRDSRDQADFVVEARAGAVGTDRSDLLFGIPATNVPQLVPLQGVPTAIPEVPLAKRRDQRGVAKISMFAYQRQTGKPVWQSGLAIQESSSNDVWLFGTGPFQHGTIYQTPTIVAQSGKAQSDKTDKKNQSVAASHPDKSTVVDLSSAATFASPDRLAKEVHRLPAAAPDAVAAAPATKNPAPSTIATPSTAGSPSKAAAASPGSGAVAATAGDSQSDAKLPEVMVQLKKADPAAAAPKPIAKPSETLSARNLANKPTDSSLSHPTDPTALPRPQFDSL
jgi:hypothetical protein